MKEKGRKERKLTQAELRRKAHFEALIADMEGQGWTAHNLTMGAVKANVLALVVMLPFAVAFTIWYLVVNDGMAHDLTLPELLLMLVLLIVLMAVHEGIHGLVWGLCAPSRFQSIEFGMVWATLSPYCTCAEPMKKGQYLLGSAMPTLVLGFGLGAVSVFTGVDLLLYLSVMMIFGGGGDFCIMLKLLAYRPRGEVVYCDHPYEVGLVAFERPGAC